jgi:O-antigen ligase
VLIFPVQAVLAALVVLAPKALVVLVAGVAVVGLLIWAFGGDRRTRQAVATPSVPLPAVWTATLVTLGVFILDVQGIFTHGDTAVITPLRYLLIPVPIGVLVLSTRHAVRTSRIRVADVLLAILLAWGLTASLVYKLLAGGEISGLSLFLPMTIAFAHLVQRGGQVSEDSARRMLELLSYSGGAYVFVHLAAGLGVPGIARGAHGHQTSFLLALAVAAAVVTGRRKLPVVELGAIAGIYLLYPAATYVTTAGAVLVTILLLSPSKTGLRKAVIVATGATVVFLGFSSSLSSDQDSFANAVLPKYFNALGKDDNSDFRREMLKLGVERVKASPVIGANFTAGFALPTRFTFFNRAVLPHNDFLQLALAGGLLALGLFVGWAAATNMLALRRYRQLVDAGADAHAQLVWVLLLAFNACLAVALFQPVLFEVGTVILFFLLFACMRMACEHRVEGEAPAEAEVASARRRAT